MVPQTLVLSPGLKIEKVYVGYWFWAALRSIGSGTTLAEIFSRTKQDFDPTTAEARSAFAASQNHAKKRAPKKRRVAAAA